VAGSQKPRIETTKNRQYHSLSLFLSIYLSMCPSLSLYLECVRPGWGFQASLLFRVGNRIGPDGLQYFFFEILLRIGKCANGTQGDHRQPSRVNRTLR
jgi:hypothetical protein